jgi:hypothetical protein
MGEDKMELKRSVSKRMLRTVAIGLAIALVAVSLVVPLALAAGGGSGKNAQGIMVNLTTGGSFAIVGTQEYQLNYDTAGGYFTNTQTGDPTVSCNGSAANCADSNKPATPSAPAPLASKVSGTQAGSAVKVNFCTFLNGGTLSGTSYTQSLTVNGVNGKGNWTFTWTYTVAPDPTKDADSVADGVQVDALTAWDLIASDVTNAVVDVNAVIAGESVVLIQNGKTNGNKYSFSLLDSAGQNRVQNLTLTVTDSADNIIFTATPASTVNYPVDFTYATNAGSNGTVAMLQNGDARTILNSDAFAGNNDGGADGSALANAVMDTVQVEFASAGTYKVTLTGTVKDNAGMSDTSFNVTESLDIIYDGGGQCNN